MSALPIYPGKLSTKANRVIPNGQCVISQEGNKIFVHTRGDYHPFTNDGNGYFDCNNISLEYYMKKYGLECVPIETETVYFDQQYSVMFNTEFHFVSIITSDNTYMLIKISTDSIYLDEHDDNEEPMLRIYKLNGEWTTNHPHIMFENEEELKKMIDNLSDLGVIV